MAIASINPATGEKVKEFAPFDDAEIEKRLKSAENAFRKYRRTAFSQRSELLEATAELLLQEKERLAEIITLEMGKLFPASVEEILKCAHACRFYAENAERFLEDEPAQTDAARSYVRYEPLGPVLAIMPWNFPFWQGFGFAAPALMAGNVGLLKHASNVSQCALAIEKTFRSAGFPDGVFQTLLASGQQTEALIDDPRIRAITLTGSDITGSKVGTASGRALKKSVLELGGSDPFIVLADADVAAAAETGVRARNQNTAQSCIAAKRFIVVESVADEFEQRFIDGVANLKVGDPMQRETQIGPL